MNDHGFQVMPGVALVTDSRISNAVLGPRDDGAKLWPIAGGVSAAIAGRIALLEPRLEAAKREIHAHHPASGFDLVAVIRRWLLDIPADRRDGLDRTQLMIGLGLPDGAGLWRMDSLSDFEPFPILETDSIGDDSFAEQVWDAVRQDSNLVGIGEAYVEGRSGSLASEPGVVAVALGAALYTLGEALPDGTVGGPIQAWGMQGGDTTVWDLTRISLSTRTYVDTVTVKPQDVRTLTGNDVARLASDLSC